MEFVESLAFMLNAMSPYILLGFLIAGMLHTFISPQTLTRHLSGTGFKSVAKAALFGIPLPLCSCGVLPTAVSLRRSGASKAAATSFIVATPQTGVESIAVTYAMLGPAFACIRPVAAVLTALGGGALVGGFEGKKGLEADCESVTEDTRPKGWRARIKGALRYGMVDMVDSIGLWLLVGLLVAAVITVLVPDQFFLRFKDYSIVTMLMVVSVAIVMNVCATGSIPIAMSLMLKGLSPGTALVFLMAGPAASLASITIVAKTMGRRTAALYLGAILGAALLFGLLIDLVLPQSWFALPAMGHGHAHHHDGGSWFASGCSLILVGLLLAALIRRMRRGHHHAHC